MSRLFLYGASGHAKVIAEIAEDLQQPLAGAFDKNLLIKKLLDKYPVHLNLNTIEVEESDSFVVAIGNNELRKRIAEIELQGRNFTTLIHPSAVVSKYAELEEGTVVMAGATINVDVQIGKHCIINTNSSVDHDCVIEDYVHISPNVALAGNVLIGEGTHVGIGATVIQGVNIGNNCIIGAGATVIHDVPSGVTVVGTPARILDKK